ncbi:MAG: Redoxin [Verrucomicrobiales bacterium]|nr:Redoxin [Verrucomicrobiales bacterium]
MKSYFLGVLCLLALMITGPARAEDPLGFNRLAIGEAAPDFKLPGIDGRNWTLADFAASDVLMVYFTSNHCPVCHAHDPRLLALLKELKGKSLAVVAINPNSPEGLRPDELGYSKYDDSFEDMKLYAKDEGFTFPYLYDGDTQKTAKAYGCLATPHVFLFDKARRLQYQGWFDDSRFSDPSTVKSQDTKKAVLALLDGKPVPVPVTRPFGCSTKWLEKKHEVATDNAHWEKAPVTLESIDAAGVAALAKNPTGKYRLINVWSTTCAPCVQEFPGLMRVSRRMGLREFELITLTTDLPEDLPKARAFLEKQRAVLPSGLADSLKREGRTTNNYLFKEASMQALITALDPVWEGPQPHTVLIAPGGKIIFRHTGALTEAELLDQVLKVMSNSYQPGK